MTSAAALPVGADAPGEQPGLNDVLMAMDVVDTLRHQDALVLKELGEDERDDALKQRLREIYEGQGLTVTDRILDEGIRSLREDRFTYRPQGSWFARRLAGMWLQRVRCLAIAGLVAAGVGGAAYYGHWQAGIQERLQIELAEVLPDQLKNAATYAISLAKEPEAVEKIEKTLHAGEIAIAGGDAAAAKEIVADLNAIAVTLGQQFKLRIVSQPGRSSAVYRIPDDNPMAKNYYLIVEAIDDHGSVLSQSVLNEETGRAETVHEWGKRVPFETYEAVRLDKTSDGIIDDNILGEKPAGYLSIKYNMSVMNGAITKW
ncbi:MAG: DUF6384 family protein [Azoarcus sp.]|jgi:hypothetical protein|nr:DUF6384 family protein [Azoarcus sp.]